MSDSVERFVGRRVADGWMPGAAWWVEDRDCVIRGAAGFATLTPEVEALRFDTPFDLASLTKPLATALLLVMLEQEGAVSLDRAVGEMLEELRGSPWGEVTALELAAHRAGLPAWRPLYLEASTLEDFLRTLRNVPRAVESDRTLYSDLGYLILGALVERAGRAPLDRLFRTRIARPLGLKRAGFAVEPSRFRDAAATEVGNAYERAQAGREGSAHAWRLHPLRGEVHDGNAHALGEVAGHAGLFATVEDVASLAREILCPRVLPLRDHARRRLLEPVPGSAERTVGFALARSSKAARGVFDDEAPGHTGFTGSSLWLDPQRCRLFVLLSHRVHPVVQSRDFQLVRRGFHRIAKRALDVAPGSRLGRPQRPT